MRTWHSTPATTDDGQGEWDSFFVYGGDSDKNDQVALRHDIQNASGRDV